MDRIERPDRSLVETVYRRRWVALTAFVFGLIALIAIVSTMKPKFGSASHVLLINDQAGRDPANAGLDMPTIATSTTVLGDVKVKLHLSSSIADLQKNITAHVPPRSSIMTIAYRDTDPALAIEVPNAVADSFVTFYSTLPQSRSNAVLDAFNRDLITKRSALTAIERRLELASSGHSYVGSQTSLDNLGNQLTMLREQRGLAYSQMISDESDLAADRAQPERTAKIVRHEVLVNNPEFKQMSLDVARDVSNYETFKAGVKDEYPGMAGLQDKVSREKSALSTARQRALSGPDAYSPSLGGQIVAADKASAAVAGDKARVSALDAEIQSAQSELVASSGTQNSVGALRVLRDAAESQYQTLSQRLSTAQANAAESNTLGQAVVVDRAVKADPNIIGPKAIFLGGILLVLLLSAGAAYLAEIIDPKLLSPADVESLYGRPTLGSLRT